MNRYKAISYMRHGDSIGFGIVYNRASVNTMAMGIPTHNISITLWKYTFNISIGFNKRTYVCPYTKEAI